MIRNIKRNRKETAGNSLLHYRSAHPPHFIKSIPKSQHLRDRRNGSTETHFDKQVNVLREQFLDRDYSNRSLKKEFMEAKANPRELLIFQGESNDTSKKIRPIMKFNNKNKNLRCILTPSRHSPPKHP